jgi:hypothetical protein
LDIGAGRGGFLIFLETGKDRFLGYFVHKNISCVESLEFEVNEFRVNEFRVNEFRVNEFRVNEFRVNEFRVNEFRVNELIVPSKRVSSR